MIITGVNSMFKRDIFSHAYIMYIYRFTWIWLVRIAQASYNILSACAQICDDVALAIDHEAVVAHNSC